MANKVELQALLRQGLRVDQLGDRARHFAQSAQADGGGRATPLARELLASALTVFLAKLRHGIDVFGARANSISVFDSFFYLVNKKRNRISMHLLPTGARIDVFDAGSPMRTFVWVSAIDFGPVLQGVDEQTTAWIQHRLTRFARRHIDGIALRRSLSRMLALCPHTLIRARRLGSASPGIVDCPGAWFDAAARSAAILDEVQSIAPGVLPLVPCLFAFPERRPSKNLLRVLQKKLYFAGGKPSDWDRLVKSRPRVLWESLRKRIAVSWINPMEFVAAWCRAHRGLPPTVQLTRGMWLTLLRPNGEGIGDALTLPGHWPESPRLIQSAMAASVAARAAGRHEDFLRDWARVIRWRADFMDRGITAQPTTFSGALRRAKEDERRARAAALATHHVFPPFPMDRWAQGDWEAVDLDTPMALVEHAIEQAHCGETLVGDCASGRYRVFAVRNQSERRSIGTVALVLDDDQWLPSSAKRFANQPPSTALVDFLFQFAQAVAEKRGQHLTVTARMRRDFALGSPRLTEPGEN